MSAALLLADQFTGLGIFFDTYANSRHSYTFPRISAMMGDGKKSYDLATDGAVQEFAGCSVRLPALFYLFLR